MNSTILTVISIALSTICAILLGWPLIFKKKKGLGTITRLGKIIIYISLLLIIVGTWNLFLTNKEKKDDENAMAKRLTDSFNIALKKYDTSLKYSRAQNKIGFDNRNIMVNFEGSHIEGLKMSGNTFIFDSSAKREPHLPIDPDRIIKGIENYAEANNIKNKSVILEVALNSNGYEYVGDIEAILISAGYQIIKRRIQVNPELRNSLLLRNDSTNVIVTCGNNPPLNASQH